MYTYVLVLFLRSLLITWKKAKTSLKIRLIKAEYNARTFLIKTFTRKAENPRRTLKNLRPKTEDSKIFSQRTIRDPKDEKSAQNFEES